MTALREARGGVRKPTAAQLRQMRRDNAEWPAQLKSIPLDQFPPYRVGMRQPFAAWRSRQFLVQAFDEGGVVRLSVNRTEWDERRRSWREDIAWDDLQRLKAEAGFADRWAVECYPPDAAVVNVANMRHIWLLDAPPAFGWNRRTASEAA